MKLGIADSSFRMRTDLGGGYVGPIEMNPAAALLQLARRLTFGGKNGFSVARNTVLRALIAPKSTIWYKTPFGSGTVGDLTTATILPPCTNSFTRRSDILLVGQRGETRKVLPDCSGTDVSRCLWVDEFWSNFFRSKHFLDRGRSIPCGIISSGSGDFDYYPDGYMRGSIGVELDRAGYAFNIPVLLKPFSEVTTADLLLIRSKLNQDRQSPLMADTSTAGGKNILMESFFGMLHSRYMLAAPDFTLSRLFQLPFVKSTADGLVSCETPLQFKDPSAVIALASLLRLLADKNDEFRHPKPELVLGLIAKFCKRFNVQELGTAEDMLTRCTTNLGLNEEAYMRASTLKREDLQNITPYHYGAEDYHAVLEKFSRARLGEKFVFHAFLSRLFDE